MITTGRRFSPSINLTRDVDGDLAYLPTANAQRIYQQILNDFAVGIHSFSLIGSYGTGKSFFLVALEQTLRGKTAYFPAPNGHFGGAVEFEFINIVGSYMSLAEVLADGLGVKDELELWDKLDELRARLREQNSLLVIVIDEFGKFLEYAARVNPERELYFIQQLAEYANAEDSNCALLVTLHQNFSAYAYGLDRKQREEWEKVKGRLKELVFNEPVEQLLELAADQIAGEKVSHAAHEVSRLIKAIEDSRAFPHRGKLHEAFARRLLPFDLLAASVLTQALQRYGQNERSLFTFLNANDPYGINDFDRDLNTYFNVASVYDYLSHNYDSLLASVHNPHYAQWAMLRSALERTEVDIVERIGDARSLVKIVGLLNIFAPQGAKLDGAFLCTYAELTLGMQDAEGILQQLEAHKILRYVRYRDTFVLAEGTDLNVELALHEASSKIEPASDVTPLLRKHFVFPIVPAKAISYRTGTPRFFGYHLSDEPLLIDSSEGSVDGAINLVFTETLTLGEVQAASQKQSSLTLTCWYRSTAQIRELLLEIAKINHVISVNESDRVAVRVLQEMRGQAIDSLNYHVLHSLYADDGSVIWFWRGEEQSITGPAALNGMLSKICDSVFPDTPVLRNELINRTGVSSAVATARKAFLRALTERWDQSDLGFAEDKFPPEKTIYLTLLKHTGIHRFVDEQWVLDQPTAPSFVSLWHCGERFLEQARVAPKNVADLFESLRKPPFGLKQGFIDFWVPAFLFARREAFGLYRDDRFLPDLTAESLELIRLAPQRYQVKSFSVDGIKLRFFNRLRILIQQKSADRITKTGFVDTIRPFIVFYNALPQYARHTQRLAPATLRLRSAIANAKDPEKTFFEDFPSALGYPHIAEEQASDEEIAAYLELLQTSVHELQSCYDDLVDRIEAHLLSVLGLTGGHFPNYKSAIAARYTSLRTYLLLPRQRTLHVRLISPLEDRVAWLGAVVQSVLGRDIKQMTDEDELVVFARLRDAIQELDNLCELDTLTTDPERELSALRLEITVQGGESRKLLQRLPKQKEEDVAALQAKLRSILTDDESVNTAALIRMLQEMMASD